MASIDLEYNSGFQIYNSDGTPFHDLVLHKCTYETVVMSLGDKISGILYYKDNALDVTMSEYIIYKGVRYTLVNPPTILREGLVSDNSELRGMTKYSFTFYHPMYVLNNFPFSDIAVQSGQSRYLSQNKTFSWIGTLVDFVAKLNKNLEDTQWMVTIGNVTQEEQTKLSEVLSFDKNTIAEALKRGYETWEVPYVVDQVAAGTEDYRSGKRFIVQYGLPTTEILDEYNQPFVFQMGQGVGLKNNSRNPKNNKIITRIAGYGSEDNIPYGYPQIPYYGGNVQYPLYYGIVDGQRVQLIKHPFTRNHLMPSVYSQSVYNKVNPKLPNGTNNPNYDPTIELVDYYDANDNTYTNRIKPNSPSYEIHEFGDIKPELGEKSIISAVPVSQQETQPDYKQKSDFLQEILDRISATEIEDEKTELLDVYDRVDSGLSYYEKHGEEGGDTYWFVFSITNDDYYEYVSYESGNYNFTATMLRDGSSAPTPDWDDTMDDDGNYLQSYFKITLPILEFDLYACAAITQEMKINMRSGACIGCTFPVEVDWDDYKRNFYNSDGEFDPDGEQRDYTKYPDSSSGQITVMVKKELETFGTLMPNQYQQPTTGDKFVILGISLPNTYITSAEQRLDTDMKQYMRDNNVYYFDYPLKFDEHFLISHEDILSQMKNNVVVRFKYADEEQPKALYIKQMSVKYNESPLPKYDITLTDDIEIVLNQIGQVTDEVSKLRLGFGAGGFGTVGAEYLRKDIDDTARGTIRMIKGMQVGERFVTGLLGEGGVFRKDSDGTTYLETDKLYVRMKAYFDTVEVKHYLHTGGNRIASQASGIVCSRVEMIDAYGGLAMDVSDAVFFRCFFKANDGDKTIRNDFMIGDLAFCRETNVDVSSVNLHGYWRLVIGRNVDGFLTENKEAWIDLSNRASDTITVGGRQYSCAGYQNGSDAPIAQDDIIQLGNIVDKDRQGAIVEYVGGDDAPSYQIFQGIGEDLPYPYTLEDKNYIGLGYSSQTGHAYMNVYGDVFIGAKPDAVTGESPTYIKYDSDNEELTIKAVMEIIPTSTIGGETLEEYIQEHQTIYDDTDVLNAISDLENITDNLQDQIDGAIETLYGDVDPSIPANDPYRNYTTEEKENHLGDMYYNSTTGYAYRYDKKVEDNVTTYFWQLIRDSGITEAIAKAGEAVNLANTKGKIFTTADNVLPTPPYNINDLWVSAKGTWQSGGTNIVYDNDILKCVTAKALNASPAITDWVRASKYTDDSSLQNFISFTYDPENAQLHKQIDGKIDTFFTEATQDPSSNWTTTALKEDHVDDVWYQTDTDRMFRYIKVENGGVTSYRWDEIYDELAKQAYRHAAIAQDTADGKRRVFVSQPQDNDAYDIGDLWVNASYTSGNEIIYDNDVLRCKEAKEAGDTFSISHWQKASKYTDDTDFDNFVQYTYSNDQANLQNQIDGKYETWFLNGVPTLNNAPANEWTTIALKDEHLGDLYWDKTNLHAYRFVKDNLTYSWIQIGDNGVICAMADAANAQDTADKKRRVFLTQPTPPYDQGDLWTQGESGDIMMCVTSRSSGSYNAADWAKASKYTNDALLLTFLDGYQGNLTAITNQVDAKLDTWVSSSDPSVRWTSNDLKELHVGDIWLNTSDSTVSGVGSMKSAVYTKNGSAYSWVEDNTIPNSVFDTIDGKRSIYVTWQAWKNGNVNNLKERDLFIPASDTTQGNVTYKANKVYRCTSASQETFQEVAYTDDTKVNAIIAKYGEIMNIQAATANDIGEALGHLREVLGGSTSVDGGLVLTNAIYMKDTAATPSIWAGISGVYKTAETGTGYKGHGTASWYGGGVNNGIPIDHEVSPSVSNYAKSLFRFDGSGYLASGNITWDANGIVNIANVYANIGGTDTSLTGTLQTLTNLSNALPLTLRSGVTYLDPQYGFSQISITHDNNYVILNNSVLNYGEMKARFVPLEFFNALFSAFSVANPTSSTTPIDPSTWTVQTVINNLKINVGTWTEQYLSALGLNSQQGGGGGDVYWSQLTANNSSTGQQIHSSHLSSVTQPLYFLFNEDANPTLTYDGKTNRAVSGILTKSYADARYYQKIAEGTNYEVVRTDGTRSELKTINGNSLFGSGNITISGGSATLPKYIDFLRTPSSVSGRLPSLSNLTMDGVGVGNGYSMMRLDLCTTSITDDSMPPPPSSDKNCSGYVLSFTWQGNGFNASSATQLYIPNGDHVTTSNGENTLMYRGNDFGTWSSWYKLVSCRTGNVGSSTRPVYIDANGFAVACSERNIWGQNMQTSANISGSMSGVGDINMNGSIINDTTLRLRTKTTSNYIEFALGNDSAHGISFNTWAFRPFGAADNNIDLGDSNGAWKSVMSYGFKRKNSSDSYVLLGGGGHKLESGLSVDNAYYGFELWTTPNQVGRPTSLNFSLSKSMGSGRVGMRLDIVSSSITSDNPSSYDVAAGYVQTYCWDSAPTSARTQFYLPNGDHLESGDKLQVRGYNNVTNAWTEWKSLAFATDNAASATKLSDNTTYTAWGRTFFTNGKPTSVSGNLSSVGSITGSGTVDVFTTGADSEFRVRLNSSDSTSYAFNVGFFGTFGSAAGKNLGRNVSRWGTLFAIGVDLSSGEYSPIKLLRTVTGGGAGIDYCPSNQSTKLWRVGCTGGYGFQFALRDGSSEYQRIIIAENGYVGINATSPSQRLHVEGNIYANGRASINTTATSGILTVSRGSTNDFAIDTIGQQRYKYDSGDTSDLSIGLFSSNKCPFIRFTDTLGGYIDVQMVPVTSGGTVTDYLFSIGKTSHTSRIIARNFRVYTRISSDDSGNVQAMQALMNGRLLVGSADTTLVNGNTDCKFLVNGNMCTSAANGSFVKIGNVYLIYDSNNNAIKVAGNAAGTSAANFYSMGAVSALGANTSSGGGGLVLNEPLSAINTSGLSSPTVNGVTLVWNGSKWVYSQQVKVTVNSLETISGGITSYTTLDVRGTSKFTGNVGIAASASGTYKLYIGGGSTSKSIYAEGDIYTHGSEVDYSDIRQKNIISYINDLTVNVIAGAPIFRYTWKDRVADRVRVGTSAQYWQSALPQSVVVDDDGYLGMSYATTALIAAVVNARKLQNHEDRIAYLERENEQLRNEIKQLKAA